MWGGEGEGIKPRMECRWVMFAGKADWWGCCSHWFATCPEIHRLMRLDINFTRFALVLGRMEASTSKAPAVASGNFRANDGQ